MKRNYIIPVTEKVNFGTDETTMSFTNMTDASNAGHPGNGAPGREGSTVKLTKMYI